MPAFLTAAATAASGGVIFAGSGSRPGLHRSVTKPELRVRHIADQVRLCMRVVDAVDDDLAPAVIGHDVALRHLENRCAAEVAGAHVGIARSRSIEHAAEMRSRALADDQG